MIDIKTLKEKREQIQQNIHNRKMKVNLERVIELGEKRLEFLTKAEAAREKRNQIAAEMKGKIDQALREKLIAKGKEIKDVIAQAEAKLAEIEEEYFAEARKIPNDADPDAPVGTEEEGANKVVKRVGEPPKFSFAPLDHVQIGEKCKLIDFDTATRVSGQKFYYLTNEAVLLELALEQFAIQKLVEKGFTPVITPDVAKVNVLEGIGFNPRGEESNIYSIEGTDACLVGTAEITLGGMFAGQIIDEGQLPRRFVGLSHCFRREAGAAGQFSKGLYRVHQFSKVEMFSFVKPEDSKKEHEQLLSIEEEIFSELGIAYQVIDTCTGDLGAPAARKFDIEAWMPGRNGGEYGEVTSTSNCTDYQARSLGIKFRESSTGKTQFVHTLNGTAVAVSRAIVAILENYQTPEGGVTIPKVLQPLMGGITEIKPRV